MSDEKRTCGMEGERSRLLELREERKTSTHDDGSDNDTPKRRKQSPEVETIHLVELREERRDEVPDTDPLKRKKQSPGEGTLKSTTEGLWSPRSVKQLRKSWENIKIKARRAHASCTRQRLKSVGGSPEKAECSISSVSGGIAGDTGGELRSIGRASERGVLSRALSASTTHLGFSSLSDRDAADQDMLDQMSDYEVSDHDMSDRPVSDNRMSDRDVSDHEMSNQEKSVPEMTNHKKLDHEKSDPEMSDTEEPRKHNWTTKLLQLKLKHYESLLSHEQHRHELEMRVKWAQLEAAESQKAACEEVVRMAVGVRESMQSMCHKWEDTAESLQKTADVYLQKSTNNFFDSNMND